MLIMAGLTIKTIDGGVTFRTKIVPGSSKTAFSGLLDGMLKVKISAPPEKGNKSLSEFLAKQLGVKTNAISITAGHTNPVKTVQVLGLSAEILINKLNLNKQDHS